jgi:hypothetical protein
MSFDMMSRGPIGQRGHKGDKGDKGDDGICICTQIVLQDKQCDVCHGENCDVISVKSKRSMPGKMISICMDCVFESVLLCQAKLQFDDDTNK